MSKHSLEIQYEEFPSIDALSPEERELAVAAMAARKNAYAPYSKFAVGAALRTQDGHIFLGSNQENVNFKGSCAERVALDAASTAGYKTHIRTIAICGSLQDDEHVVELANGPISPCGQCRQDLKEVEDVGHEPLIILLVSATSVRRFVGMHNLLPFGVGPKGLGDSIRSA